MEKIWKTIPSLDGYEASSEGEIRKGARTLAQYLHKAPRGEYLRVQVWINGKRKNKRVNRLVCEAFHGEAPTPRHHARHKDNDPMNNQQSNLIWGTAKENWMDQLCSGSVQMPSYPEDLSLAHIWHNKKPSSPHQAKYINKIRMLKRIAGD